MTTIKAKQNLFNGGQCFTKGKTYTVNANIKTAASLMDCQTVNDLKEPHIIGVWWRKFTIIKTDYDN